MSQRTVRGPGPLGHLAVEAVVGGPDVAHGAAVLQSLGAAVHRREVDGPGSLSVLAGAGLAGTSVRTAAPTRPLPGLPAQVPARATGILLALAALATSGSGREVVVDPDDAATLLLLPVVMAASYSAAAPARKQPLRWRDGWLAAELSAADDEDAFARMVSTLPAAAGVAEVCTEAQVWRLPVVPFRRWASAAPGGSPSLAGAGVTGAGSPGAPGTPEQARRLPRVGAGPAPLAGVRVLDATVMWAGPLATWLLEGLGAQVSTIEPASRPDGARARGGGGIYPHDRLVPGDGTRSGMFNALAGTKDRWDLDLRHDGARQALRQAVATADVVVDNLSPRARDQLGVTATQLRPANPALVSVTMPAFAAGDPHRSWVAYGSQIHAWSGLAWGGPAGGGPAGGPMTAADLPVAAATAYPDALTGLMGAVVTVAALLGRDAGWRPDADLEVPLAASVAALAPAAGDGERLGADPGPVAAALLERRPWRFVRRLVDGEPLAHPRPPALTGTDPTEEEPVTTTEQPVEVQ